MLFIFVQCPDADEGSSGWSSQRSRVAEEEGRCPPDEIPYDPQQNYRGMYSTAARFHSLGMLPFLVFRPFQTKTLMGEVMKEAAFSLAEAKFLSGDFNQVVLQNVTKAQIKIRTKKDNVAGVTLPVFESYQDGSDTYELTGLAKGGQQMQKLKKNYQSAVKLLVELASLQTSFVTLDEVIKITNRRVNAIEHGESYMYCGFFVLPTVNHQCYFDSL